MRLRAAAPSLLRSPVKLVISVLDCPNPPNANAGGLPDRELRSLEAMGPLAAPCRGRDERAPQAGCPRPMRTSFLKPTTSEDGSLIV
jgi:hypothetical protein